jgi:hypothetical protein
MASFKKNVFTKLSLHIGPEIVFQGHPSVLLLISVFLQYLIIYRHSPVLVAYFENKLKFNLGEPSAKTKTHVVTTGVFCTKACFCRFFNFRIFGYRLRKNLCGKVYPHLSSSVYSLPTNFTASHTHASPFGTCNLTNCDVIHYTKIVKIFT